VKAVELYGFGAPSEVLRVNASAPEPVMAPNDVLVRVHAASVNPLDCRRRLGYGRNVYSAMGAGRFPIVLGCDFSGVVARVGPRVSRYKEGDEVWGAQEPFRPGCQAEYVAIRALDISFKPRSLGHVDAASLPYVALTAWAALVRKGGLSFATCPGKHVLVHGGSGGVGAFSIQLLKAWGARVTATCSTDKVEFVKGLGADAVLDRAREDFTALPRDFDLVLDVPGGDVTVRSLRVLKPGGRLVSLHSPLMPLTDKYGPRRGFAMLLGTSLFNRSRAALSGVVRRDAFFNTDGEALETIAQLVDERKIRATVDRIFPPEEVDQAHAYLESGAVKGKVVLAFA
jgi:NADPH:quinone reductase-like Zn-dependent oxidoreductase